MDKRIAVIGCSLRLPSCDNTESLWEALLEKRDLVTEVHESRWSKDAWKHPDKKHPGSSYTFAAGSLGDVSGFDAAFFGLSPREVTHMDPQQRLLLEMSWEAMERACIAPSTLRGSNTGVFMGIASVDYAYRFADDFSAIDANTGTGTASSIASNRISYLFDLKGPSVSMDTACSSSMVAFHQACQSILSGESDLALTGGISLHLHPYGFMIFSKATMLSPDGRCKVWDEDGNGYVRSEGGGVFLLKDYDKAVADGDPIIAVVAATAVNTDGYKSGITVPNPDAQIALMRKACERAGLEPDQIDYIEAHGTGTSVGDPIETRAISEALARQRTKPLKIGSVKSNLGHLETASGVAGLAKALLSIHNRQVPATIGLRKPNPNIRFDEWNIEAVTETLELPKTGQLTIGVNSFGFGGANAHVILQSPPEASEISEADHEPGRDLPLILTARNADALKVMAERTADQLASAHAASLYNLCWSARFRREQHEQALLLWARDKERAAAALRAFAKDEENSGVFSGRRQLQEQGSVWVYSGNGCQWAGMGRQLLEQSSQVRETVAEVNALIKQYSDICDVEKLLGEPQEADCYDLTELAQPALFALQVAVTRYLRDQGIKPVAVTGHSVGEVAAAWASGALTLEQAARVICIRSHYQGQTAGSGEMTAVALDEQSLNDLIAELECDRVAVAGVNSAKGSTLAGEPAQLELIETRLREQSVRFKRLSLNYAFHSPCMDPIETGLKEALAGLQPGDSEIPFISTVTGEELGGKSLDAEYWWRNIRQPVLFEKAISNCLEKGQRTFIEIGAHPVLRTYLNECLRAEDLQGQVIATLSRGQDGAEELERALAELILSGAKIDESAWFPVQGKAVALPDYPWQKQPYWKPDSTESLGLLSRHYRHPLLGYTLPHQPGIWESQLDTGRQPWLADHVVGDGVVFPGAGYAELALAAIEQHLLEHESDAAWIDIEGLEIQAPMLLEAGTTKVVSTSLEEVSGKLRIKARPYAHEGEWQNHVKARWFAGSAGRLLDRQGPGIPERAADFNREQHLSAASHIGLDYGPAFQGVSEGWVDGDTVIGRYQPTEEIKQTHDGLLLHPGILDTAFQLFIPLLAQEKNRGGFGYVPVQIERLQFSRANIGVIPALVRVRLVRRSPHSLLAEVELFDAEGEAVAVLTGVRFKAVPLRKQQSLAISKLDMPLLPLPLPQVPSAVNHTALLQALAPFFADQSEDRMITEVEPLLDTLVLAGLEHGVSEKPVRLAQLGDQQKRWAEMAIKQGMLAENEAGDLIVPEPPEVDLAGLWELLLREYPEAFGPVHAVGRFGLHLSEWLHQTGSLPELTERAWSETYRARYEPAREAVFRDLLAEQLHAQLQDLQPGQRLAMAEVCAGEMILTPSLAAQIKGVNAELCFLSSSSAAVTEARAQLHNPEQLQALHWDKQTLPAELGLLDLVIIHLDFMRPSEVRQLLQQLRTKLRTGAQVMLMGLPQAFWLEQLSSAASDLLEQEGSLQPGVAHWTRLLSGLGYEIAQQLEDPEQPGSAFLLAASQPLEVEVDDSGEPARLLVLTDQTAQALSDELLSHCERAQAFSSSDDLLGQLSEEVDSSQTTQVVLLAGAWSEGSPEQTTKRCAEIRDLVKSLDAKDEAIRLTVITAGVGAAQLTPQALPQSEQVISQTAVWGFVRTLMNETALPLQLIDLPADPAEIDAAAFEQALSCSVDEDEQYLVAAGERYVPRLMHAKPAEREDSGEPNQSFTLGFDQPGQLKNLRWKPRELALPGDEEVAVEVKATGLNFRDVMYALGLLADEAIENGFSGPAMGLEFAGIVTSVGAGVTDFRPGDKVVGFGSASFSTQMVTGAETLAHLPADISFEAAATIPTTFFTVYYALKHLARLQPGERLLIHGAAGGVGLAAIQIGRLMGAEIFTTVGSASKRDVVRLLGIDAIYDSRSHTFAEEILADTDGQGVDVVLNSLAGEAVNQNLRVLRPFGRFLELGKRDFYENTAIGLRPFRNNISYFGIDSDQLMKVHPTLTRTLFREMMALFEEGELYPLPYTAFAASNVVDAFRYMQQAKQIGKVVVNYPRLPDASQPPLQQLESLKLSADKTFLVTGGLGGFGLRTAQWLVEKGVRHLALLSRRGKAEGGEAEIIAQLSDQGVDVQAYACDVSDKALLQETLELIEQQQPSLAGVVHAATVFADGLVENMSDEQISQVLGAKAFGAQYLHELTVDKPIELFLMFSSATTLFGNPGQANYVAANLALEALTHLRKAQGLAATCVRWGAIDDAGYLARNTQIKQALQSRMGGDALTTARALAVLEQMLLQNQSLLGVMEFDWSALARFLPKANAARYQLIARSHDGSDSGDKGGDLLAELLSLEPEEQLVRIAEELKQSLGQILMLSADQINPEQSVYDLGFDSLMGVELITAIEDRFGVQLPAMAISESPTIAKLSVKLQERISGEHDDSDDVTHAQIAAQHGVSEKEVKGS
ncbi:type I polyketide synthase [Marinobacterium lutimaris]|uniref:Acyl transferase domain-containing protein n=1 Tax=Marinobacterium lutimaris TaxID=568106 RepID=A0A1H6B4Z8_9GAMM|nr:type I polyketide synthase [Marinobacterium lutimaris]SEG55206.1 Acyl transferase domain-containing protein [Marinobacterium lutimaris]